MTYHRVRIDTAVVNNRAITNSTRHNLKLNHKEDNDKLINKMTTPTLLGQFHPYDDSAVNERNERGNPQNSG